MGELKVEYLPLGFGGVEVLYKIAEQINTQVKYKHLKFAFKLSYFAPLVTDQRKAMKLANAT